MIRPWWSLCLLLWVCTLARRGGVMSVGVAAEAVMEESTWGQAAAGSGGQEQQGREAAEGGTLETRGGRSGFYSKHEHQRPATQEVEEEEWAVEGDGTQLLQPFKGAAKEEAANTATKTPPSRGRRRKTGQQEKMQPPPPSDRQSGSNNNNNNRESLTMRSLLTRAQQVVAIAHPWLVSAGKEAVARVWGERRRRRSSSSSLLLYDEVVAMVVEKVLPILVCMLCIYLLFVWGSQEKVAAGSLSNDMKEGPPVVDPSTGRWAAGYSTTGGDNQHPTAAGGAGADTEEDWEYRRLRTKEGGKVVRFSSFQTEDSGDGEVVEVPFRAYELVGYDDEDDDDDEDKEEEEEEEAGEGDQVVEKGNVVGEENCNDNKATTRGGPGREAVMAVETNE